MDPTTPFEWSRVFWGIQPPGFLLEIALRVVIVYIAGVVVLSFADKRSHQQWTSFDLLILIALGSVMGDVLFYPEVPIVYALVVLVTMLLLNRGMARLQARYEPLRRLIAGRTRELVREGRILEEALAREALSREELMSMLRTHEVSNTGEIRSASMEFSGQLGLLRYPKGEERAGTSTMSRDDRPAGSAP
jgi:uncharacterized membrane protein YcaP (DUF421 family)